MTTDPRTRTTAAIQGRRADTNRRRERVTQALTQAINDGLEVSVASIAAAAAVDRTFLYRHRDLLEKIHLAQTAPPDHPKRGPQASRASLQADLLAAHGRATRANANITQLENRLSAALGEQVWAATGLGAPPDLDTLAQRITELEQRNVDLGLQLQEREEELAAARAANRELMAKLNTAQR